MTPDKIYVTTYSVNSAHGNKWGLWTERECVGDAYIRKDALLEWAKETYLSENASAIRKVCYKQLIDKLNSL